MSSYRSSYTPWKTSLGSTYKAGGSYLSRDDITGSGTRYSSALSTPSTYRPSFSGGTYRIKRDPVPPPVTTYVSRYGGSTSVKTEPKLSDICDSKASQLKRYTSTNSTLGKYARSRDPSPAAIEHTNRIKSREPSPVARSLRGKSRDPSPVIDNGKSNLGFGSYRMSSNTSTATSSPRTGYTSRYGGARSSSRLNGNSSGISMPDKSISYLTTSDFHARSASRARELATRKSNEKELEETAGTAAETEHNIEETNGVANESSDATSAEEEVEVPDEPETFISVSVVTRATSPTPPGNTTVHRTRRIDIAKTIEKTIQRSTKRHITHDKEIQSDRMDDSTRYLRYSGSSRVSASYSPHSDRYSAGSLRYSVSPLSSISAKSTANMTTEPKKEEVSSSKSSGKSSASSKSKLSPPKIVRINSRQSSVENLANKPPAAPKAESPTKSITSHSSGSPPVVKWPNKDFRKSALNVGPTDRPRKSRTPSSGAESEPVNGAISCESTNGTNETRKQSLERSPSGGSEVSVTSVGSGKRTGKSNGRLNQKTSTTQPTLSRHNSSTSLKCHKSCAPAPATATTSSSGTNTANSSSCVSSGTESSTCDQRSKTMKKHAKKKTPNSHNKDAKVAESKERSTGEGDNELSSKKVGGTKTKTSTSTSIEKAYKNSNEETSTVIESPPPQQPPHSKSKSTDTSTANNHRLQRLSSVSNFLAAHQHDANSEPIFFESSDSSGEPEQLPLNSLTEDTQTNTTNILTNPTTTIAGTTTSKTKITTSTTTNSEEAELSITNASSEKDLDKSKKKSSSGTQTKTTSLTSVSKSTPSSTTHCPQETTTANATSEALASEPLSSYATTAATITSTTDDQEEPSWWQDTSLQINTASALDYKEKDEMHYRLRHIDSGEQAWWLRNDDAAEDDDTLAEETLNHDEDEADKSAATEPVMHNFGFDGQQRKLNWWTNEEAATKQLPQNDKPNNDESMLRNGEQNEHNENTPIKKMPRSRISPEAHAWWLDDDNEQEEEKASEEKQIINEESNESNKENMSNGHAQFTLKRNDSTERAWWETNSVAEDVNNNEETVEATIRLPIKPQPLERSSSNSKPSKEQNGTTHWWLSGPTKKLFNVQRVESGEKAWWQEQPEDEPKKPPTPPPRANIRHWESGERAWWLTEEEAEQQNGRPRSGSVSSDNEEEKAVKQNADAEMPQSNQLPTVGIDTQAELSNSFNFTYAERPPPLGQCASPVQMLEEAAQFLSPASPPETRQLCRSPYDNIPMSKMQSVKTTTSPPLQQQQQSYAYYSPQQYNKSNNQQQQQQQQQQQKRREKLFISRHQNIDELLGGSCRPLSPLFFDVNSGGSGNINGRNFESTTLASKNMFLLEEITPDQVRIHDSTAQMPVIQRIDRDEWEQQQQQQQQQFNYGAPPACVAPQRLDDAAIQVYKDGDYGAYLDLESSLAEQAEEIEGLNASRKNSLVVRTQLSVRVHAIIEKLLSAEGSDLRRALFSLKQVFQEDKDLVHAFVALGGLNCLVRVGNGADQNYQNYILRALGQVMLYVDGMNGVMKHEPTMQWLYSLIASNYRSVVKTALKLLLVFVEYAESNCYVLVNAIHAVDKSQGTLPWSNIMRLLKDYDNADAELVIYATSLINKTLAGLNDQDSFYDESDLLEQQGMESVIQRYMSKKGTDLDLLDQLQLYEAVLKFEDGESDGQRLPENSVRKTQRYRPGANTTERRKSRRHSTDNSPSVIMKVLATPKRLTPTQGTLDEDSSGSTNSTEFSGGLFQEKKLRDAAGVTPGLRRRRERAERHKSFLKEQQEAAANGIFAALEKREGLGQIVTAIPATIQSGGDSPPESLQLHLPNSNENITNNNNNNNTNITSNYNTNMSNMNITASHATNSHATATSMATPPSTLNIISQQQNNIANINNNHNNNNQSNLLLSPTKQLLSGSNSISIINNSFDKSSNNNNNNNNNSANEFLTKKNLFRERNATVINGIMKNIQQTTDSAYKKYENDANRLNNYYSQLNQSPKHQQTPTQLAVNPNPTSQIQTAQNVLAAVLSPKKTLNGFDFTASTPMREPLSSLGESPKLDSPLSLDNASTCSPSSPLSPVHVESNVFDTPQITNYITPISLASTKVAAPTPPTPPPPPPLPPADWLRCGLHLPNFPQQPIQNPTNNTPNNNNQPTQQLDDASDGTVVANPLQITESDNEDKKLLLQLKRDHTVKDLTQKLCNMPMSPTQLEAEQKNRICGDMTGLISKAKEGLAKSKSKGEMSRSSSVDQELKKSDPKKSENELHWEELVRNMARPLNLCDLDFTDLNSEDEKDVLAPRGLSVGIPPPPPPLGVIPPPMMPNHIVCPPPMSLMPPAMFNYSGYGNTSLTNSVNSSLNGSVNGDLGMNTIKKNKKTVKLFWKEVREDMIPVVIGKTIWDELPNANVDTQKLEHLFESRAKDLMTKKQQELNKSKEIIVLDHKRSNAINIAITKLPPPRAIKAAILKMDATVVTREGIDKLLNMLPTDEERGKIQEAQMANPELPLGSAEQFLLTLASISELGARLKLWAFRLDFDNSEKEIAEPLMDLKQGIEILRHNRTFRCILSTLLSVGIFLNGAPVKGFQIEYLAKVPEVKDTVHKHSLLHHLCHMVMESGTETTDLYSEIGPITRASKADFTDLAYNLTQLESECKASWDRLKLIAKHDCPPPLKQKLVDFLADCAERIIILQIVHRRVMNRYRKFLLWLGMPQHSVSESRPNEFCRILSEFALEYRTTRERVQQQLEKKANHRERNKTRGKLIIDMAKFKTKEDRADAELKELLGTPSKDNTDGTLTWRRRRAEQLRSPIIRQSEENFTDGDDEILESLVKTATKAPGTRTTPRERKRTRHADRKSLRRTLKNGLTDEEKQHVAALIQTY